MSFNNGESLFGRNDKRFIEGLNELLAAHWYSQDAHSDSWNFAVAIQSLLSGGLTKTDLRWLILKNYIKHAREVTSPTNDGRQFRTIGNLSFCHESCFIMTEQGAEILNNWFQSLRREPSHNGNGSAAAIHEAEYLPRWCPNSKELRFDGKVVKRFRWRAMNQETVLSAFEEDGWPVMIDDPLPPKMELDPKRRLHDTIKALNQNQEFAAIRFHGNGTGEGVRWEATQKS